MGEQNFYQKLPLSFLVDFYEEVKNNIERGILTERMHHELELIEIAAKEKGNELIKSVCKVFE